jgi:hypothetical protein
MTEFDPEEILGSIGTGGIRKQCTDLKRCGLGNICEHAQTRNESAELVSLWGGSTNECPSYTPRKELCSEGDLFRSKKKRHNQLSRSNIVKRQPGELPTAPDLMVKRHIKDGRNIKGDD